MKTTKKITKTMIIFFSVNTPEKEVKEVKHVKGTAEQVIKEILKYKEEKDGKEIIFSANREFLTPMFL